ncbi:MAG: aminopeptidase P N-terminal domain-containing protein [Acidobacteriota bacterium]|nr:MAG: aminopeptidase P N-terminal domain-containing protein [Acidobacteriota bacterium]
MRFIGKWMAMLWLASAAYGQDVALFTDDFPPEEFRARREKVYDAIGANALALIQGAPSPSGYVRFRQSNSFYYLSGVESPHAYLLLDGTVRETRLYLPHRNPRREGSEGKLLSAEDDELTRELTGVDAVYGGDLLSEHLARFASRGRVPALYTPFKPAEGAAMSRDLATRGASDIANDPWDGRPSREAHFLNRIRERFPQFAVHDLSSILDQMRLVKSPREIELIRKATRLSGLALMEAMRSTMPGMMEYELDALAKFIFYREGAQSDAYYSLIAGGPNAWYPHYHRGGRDLRAGELLLMDYAPDVGYYASDVTRMWPVDGRFNTWQRDLYGFYLATYTAILDAIRPGDVNAIMTDAATTMDEILATWKFTKPIYRDAAERFVDAYKVRAHSQGGRPANLGHGVGMAVHDVGVHDGNLVPGMVFTIEPQFRIPEEQIYIRLEDVILITDDGAENLSAFVPMDMDGIEALMKEEGLSQLYPR